MKKAVTIICVMLLAGVTFLGTRFFPLYPSANKSAYAENTPLISMCEQTSIMSELLVQQSNITSEAETLTDVIELIIESKQFELSADNILESKKFLSGAGENSDWLAFGLARYKYLADYSYYLGAVKDYVLQSYKTDKKLGEKVTDWCRIILSVAACGGDPLNFGLDSSGSKINLINDGIFMRDSSRISYQGINGWLWSLLTVDAIGAVEPLNAVTRRENMISSIMLRKLGGGGWTLSGSKFDVDLTAIAITALSPYMNSAQKYPVYGGEKTVKEVIDESLNLISSVQQADGTFFSYGKSNSISTSWVIIALNYLDIPVSDLSFVKNGNTAVDGLMSFRLSSGGFSHISGGKYDVRATEQALYSLVSQLNYIGGGYKIFNLTPTDNNLISPVYISEKDKELIQAFSGQELNSGLYYAAVRLSYLLNISPYYEEKLADTNIMSGILTRINIIRAEIAEIAEAIDKLGDVSKLGISDKSAVTALKERTEKLSRYDLSQIENYDSLIAAINRVKSAQATVITIVSLAVALILLVCAAVFSIAYRKKKKLAQQMCEIDDDDNDDNDESDSYGGEKP